LKIVVLNDNEPGKGLLIDWGWSAYVEYKDLKILVDANTDPEVIEFNSKKLGVDLSKLSFGFLTHWHRDHFGGFEYVGKISPGLEVYVPPGEIEIMEEFGLKPKIAEGNIKDGIVIGRVSIEQAIGFKTKKGMVVIVGCSHPGVDNLVKRIEEISNERIYITIGGFHFPPRYRIDALAQISDYIAPAHCTGDLMKDYIRRMYPEKYIEIRTGSILEKV